MKKSFAPKMKLLEQSPFLGPPKQSMIKQVNCIQPTSQDYFIEFLKYQKEILKKVEKTKQSNSKSQFLNQLSVLKNKVKYEQEDKKPYICDICEKMFTSTVDLKNHVESGHEEVFV